MSVAPGRRLRPLYRLIVRAYPREFRRRYGAELQADFELMLGTPGVGPPGAGTLLRDSLCSLLREHLRAWRLRLGSSPRDLARRALVPRPRRASAFGHGHGASPGGPAGRLGDGLDGLRVDVRHAWRSVRQTPGFSSAVVVTLALGIGATTAVFGIADRTLLRPIAGVTTAASELATVWHGRRGDDGSLFVSFVSYPNLLDMQERLQTLEIAGTQDGSPHLAVPGGEARVARAEFVSASYPRVLGLGVSEGRWFSDREDDPATGAAVAVLGHGTARELFDERSPIGETVLLNGRAAVVVGVAQPQFSGRMRMQQVDIWVPGSRQTWIRHREQVAPVTDRARGGSYYKFVARRAAGVTWAQVEDELARMSAWLAARWPEANARHAESGFMVFPGIGTPPLQRPMIARALWLMGGAAVFVLIIACLNVANMLLTRWLDARGTLALRKAIGACAARLVRQQMLEVALLGVGGGILGLAMAQLIGRLFVGLRMVGFDPAVTSVPVDWRAALFSGGMAAMAVLSAALFPALAATRVDPARWLAEVMPTTSGPMRLRRLLTIGQLAAVLPLLVGAALLVQTTRNLTAVDIGFDAASVYTFAVDPADQGYGDEERRVYFSELLEAAVAAPEIEAAAFTRHRPFSGVRMGARVRPAGSDAETGYVRGLEMEVSRDFFHTLRIPLRYGRFFDADEEYPPSVGGAPVAVVSAGMAERLFGTVNAVGRSIEFPGRFREELEFRVVGVVGDVYSGDLAAPRDPLVYTPIGAGGGPPTFAALLIRATSGADANAATRRIAARLDASLPVQPHGELSGAVRGVLSPYLVMAQLLATLAGAGALLAVLGIYSTFSAAVQGRVREFGVRMAVGADRRSVFRDVLLSTLMVLIAGLAIGAAGSAALTGVLESRLYGVTRADPLAWALGLAVLVAVALGSAAGPAARASRVDPVAVLRAPR